jgi:hypothetical protein
MYVEAPIVTENREVPAGSFKTKGDFGSLFRPAKICALRISGRIVQNKR